MESSRSIASALEELPWLRALAARLARGDLDEADELVQEALVAAWAQSERRPVRGQRAWLSTVLRNRWRMRQRGEIRRRAREPHAIAVEPSAPPADQLDRVRVLRTLLEHVERLPPVDRRIVMGRFFDGLNASQLAGELELPPATVRSRLKRALARLREALDEHYGGDRAAWSVVVALPRPVPAAEPGAGAIATGAVTMGQGVNIIVGLGIGALAGVGGWVALRSPEPARSSAVSVPRVAEVDGQPDASQRRWATRRTAIRRRLVAVDHATSPSPSPLPLPPTLPLSLPADEPASYAAMMEEASRAESAALEECTDGHAVNTVGVLTMRATVLGAPDLGTIFESIEIVDDRGNVEGLSECMTSFMFDFVGSAPPVPFRESTTRTTLGQPLEGLDDEQWRRTMFEAVIAAHQAEIAECEGQAEVANAASGSIELEFRFDGQPAAAEVAVIRSTASAAITGCVVEHARSWMFPRELKGPAMGYAVELPNELGGTGSSRSE